MSTCACSELVSLGISQKDESLVLDTPKSNVVSTVRDCSRIVLIYIPRVVCPITVFDLNCCTDMPEDQNTALFTLFLITFV
jgi:hypothetical protein